MRKKNTHFDINFGMGFKGKEIVGGKEDEFFVN